MQWRYRWEGEGAGGRVWGHHCTPIRPLLSSSSSYHLHSTALSLVVRLLLHFSVRPADAVAAARNPSTMQKEAQVHKDRDGDGDEAAYEMTNARVAKKWQGTPADHYDMTVLGRIQELRVRTMPLSPCMEVF